jgi:hypothetical protein
VVNDPHGKRQRKAASVADEAKVRLRLASCYPRRPLFLEISFPKTSAREKGNLDGNLRPLIGQQRRQESSVHARVINKPRQVSKRTVTSGSLCVITGPSWQRAGPGLNLIAADRPMFCTWTLDYKKWDETLKDELSQDTLLQGPEEAPTAQESKD